MWVRLRFRESRLASPLIFKYAVTSNSGVAAPVSLLVNTFGTQKVELTEGEISTKVSEIFDMKPFAIEQRLKLRNPIYKETASYGHLGREPKMVSKRFESANGQDVVEVEVELFTWEKLDFVDQIKTAFGL